MSIPTGLQEEARKLRRDGVGTMRWWFIRIFSSSLLLAVYLTDSPGHRSWLVALGLLLGQILLFWSIAQLVEGERSRIVRKLPKGASGVLMGLVPGLAFYWVLKVVTPAGPLSRAGSIATFLFIFALLVMLIEQAEAAKRASFDLLEAREQTLRARLAPHFIFNTLNTLHAQIEQDPRAAQATTERLAQLFRQVVTAADQPVIPLKQELGFVEDYLGIEKARLGSRLSVSIQIPEELESVPVLPLSLQVLVENAIKHGVAPREEGGEIRIGVERREGRLHAISGLREESTLHLWVEDPGSGLSPHRGTGTALDTLRQRLDAPEDLEMSMVDGRHRVSFRWSQA